MPSFNPSQLNYKGPSQVNFGSGGAFSTNGFNVSSVPGVPSAASSYAGGLQTTQTQTPLLKGTDLATAQQYQPQFATLYGNILGQVDPNQKGIQDATAGQIQSDVSAGYKLPPGLAREINQNTRGAEASRGNILGNAPLSAENQILASQKEQFHQNAVQAAEGYLGANNAVKNDLQAGQIGTGWAYTNPSQVQAYVGADQSAAGLGLAAQGQQFSEAYQLAMLKQQQQQQQQNGQGGLLPYYIDPQGGRHNNSPDMGGFNASQLGHSNVDGMGHPYTGSATGYM